MTVEVVLALPGRVRRSQVKLSEGATVEQAVAAADLGGEATRVDPRRLGVFGRLANPGQVLHDGDRIEIYRPLALDPKEARRRRAR
ncbi:RnfH family protein [Frateuria terrea]|uniref:RnfH family protein n=1 Tax=Frateuria terrea TaxID=529704 RepID=UPI003CCC2D9E